MLSFEHCASLQHASWALHLLSCASFKDLSQDRFCSDIEAMNNLSLPGCDLWSRVLTLGEERVDTPVYTQIDGTQVIQYYRSYI